MLRSVWIRSLLLLAAGAAAGAGGGVFVWQKLHPPSSPNPGMTSAQLAPSPPELPPEPEPEPEPEPPKEEPRPAEPAKPRPYDGPEFFGFPVASLEKSADPAPRSEPKPEPAKPKPPTVLKLRFMEGRCVAGFDGSSTLHDFSGWTKAVRGEVEFEKGRLAETAKAWAVVDARTLDTGDKGRDDEMHEKHLESAKHPEMKFTVASTDGRGTMKGLIEIHGTSREVEIPIELTLRRDGYLHVKGSVRVRMSDFGVPVPSKAGVINVKDEIRIWFEAWAEPEKEGGK